MVRKIPGNYRLSSSYIFAPVCLNDCGQYGQSGLGFFFKIRSSSKDITVHAWLDSSILDEETKAIATHVSSFGDDLDYYNYESKPQYTDFAMQILKDKTIEAIEIQ